MDFIKSQSIIKISIYNSLTRIVSTEIAEAYDTQRTELSFRGRPRSIRPALMVCLTFNLDIKMSHTLILDEEIAFGNIILRNGIQVKVNISQ